MEIYAGIDLHASANYTAVINDEDQRLSSIFKEIREKSFPRMRAPYANSATLPATWIG